MAYEVTYPVNGIETTWETTDSIEDAELESTLCYQFSTGLRPDYGWQTAANGALELLADREPTNILIRTV